MDYSEGVARRGYIFYNRTELRVHFFVETYEESRNFIRLWYFGLEVSCSLHVLFNFLFFETEDGI